MSKGIDSLREKFADIYGALNAKYQGYIQMSDKRIEHVFVEAQKLPKLEKLYVDKDDKATNVNYVLEMALYDPESKQSILIRQHNADFLVIKKELKGDEPMDSFYTVTPNTPKMKIAQIWEPKPNEFCNGWEVLEPTLLMFAGFEESKGDNHDKSTI